MLHGWELFAAGGGNGGGNGSGGGSGSLSSIEELKPSIGVFREGVDFGVENTVPVPQDYVQKLTQRAADNHELCEADEAHAAKSMVGGGGILQCIYCAANTSY